MAQSVAVEGEEKGMEDGGSIPVCARGECPTVPTQGRWVAGTAQQQVRLSRPDPSTLYLLCPSC